MKVVKKTVQFAKGLKDVTVRKLRQVMQPQLPPDWKKYVLETEEGKATRTRDTDRGVEFLAICRANTVSDDRVIALNTQLDQIGKNASESEKAYLKQLRDRASITHR